MCAVRSRSTADGSIRLTGCDDTSTVLSRREDGGPEDLELTMRAEEESVRTTDGWFVMVTRVAAFGAEELVIGGWRETGATEVAEEVEAMGIAAVSVDVDRSPPSASSR